MISACRKAGKRAGRYSSASTIPNLSFTALDQVLLHAKVFLGGLDGGVAQEHLDLLQIPAGLAA